MSEALDPEARSGKARTYMPKETVCVLGAGVIGLTTALRIRQELPNLGVTLVAEDFGINTTSHGSGGLWEVRLGTSFSQAGSGIATCLAFSWRQLFKVH